ncbi:MAG: radical SAM protein, partial [Deltaproteobacteria bacterium]|nr:radical SAM protein [Deltaproteobacteria bacterium]
MTEPSREFQVFAKPVGPTCNLKCQYCYYLKKKDIYPEGESFRMPDDILEEYIVQHIEASTEPVISFSWHGGEPTLLGLDYFRKIVDLQRKHQPLNRRIANGLQTNGTLLDDAWCRFLAAEGFAVGISIDGPQEFHDRYRLTGDQKSAFKQTVRGYKLLLKHRVLCEVLCVVNEGNVQSPIQVYRFLKQLKARYISFLPLVEPVSGMANGVSRNSVPS